MDKLSGLRIKRSRFILSHRKIFDAGYYSLIPILYYFALPGDVVTLGAQIFVRSMPMLAPLMNKNEIDVRYFQVPLRLVEPNFEQVVTGSVDGRLLSSVPSLPKYQPTGNNKEIAKYSFFDYLGVPVGSIGSDFPVCNYVPKAYSRIYWDYYRDENLQLTSFLGFDEWYNDDYAHNALGQYVHRALLQKNYFTSSLPWQLKGEIPTFKFDVSGFADFTNSLISNSSMQEFHKSVNVAYNHSSGENLDGGLYLDSVGAQGQNLNGPLKYALNNNELKLSGLSVNAAQLRSMFAETRIMERLARCGSRYVEYLTSNFGIAPRDDTLQRAQYLGGFRQPLIFTEIPQTAQDEKTPVGTLRGKGISSGGDTPVKKYLVKEFSVIFGILNIRTELLYTQGIDRTMCYSDRWDFFNPSLQNLSEQTIKNYEVFYGSDGKNNEPFGFTPMYQELRKSKNIVCGDMRDNLSYWTQPIKFSSRPNLTASFLEGRFYENSFMSPFGFTDTTKAKPFIIDCQNIVDAIRPISAFSIPGLIDHN